MMKEITAIIRPSKWPETLQKLGEAGILGLTRQRIYGRGKQKGLRYSEAEGGLEGISFLPKWMVTLVVEDEQVDRILAAIISANRTGEIGDGKIFIGSLSEVVRVRTNENEELALK